MNLTPEIKAQLAEQKKQCIFCKIVSKEQESKIVFEDDLTLATLDIFPALKGHTVFLTKEHYPIMPYIPANEFKHLFGLIPQLSNSLQQAMLSTGINVFIANGGPAGQRAPHFLIHLLPREAKDGFWNFMFDKKGESLNSQEVSMLQNNFPIMMGNHFKRNPASWHAGKGDVPSYLTDIYEKETVVYEDEKVLCVIPQKSVGKGHIIIYSKTEQHNIEKLSQEDSSHLFYAASFAATALFEGLGAHATNIICKSGNSDDNPKQQLSVHVIARWQDDSLQGLMWEATQQSNELDGVAAKIKDKTWKINYENEKKSITETATPKKEEPIKKSPTQNNEIVDAINKVMNS